MVDSSAGPCPVCDATDRFDFLEVHGLPVTVGSLCPTRESAFLAPRGDLKLSLCLGCGYIWNHAYEFGKHEYIPGYEISLHYSTVYQRFLERLAAHLVNQYELHGKTILEIACGTGHFLRMLCLAGPNQGIGVDPVLMQEGVETLPGSNTITYYRDTFSERYANLDFDFVCCRQALHAIANPKAFLQTVRRAIGGRRKPPVYFEVVNAEALLKNQIIWQLIYEYYSFFTAKSFAYLFRTCDFDVRTVQACYEDAQYLQLEATPCNATANASAQASWDCASVVSEVTAFAKQFESTVAYWQQELDKIERAGQKVVAWGAGGRGINFLNMINGSHCIPYVVDINPTRHGGFIPGTGQTVVAPAFLKEYQPEIIVLTNPTYAGEIREQVERMDMHCKFLYAS